MSKKYKPEQILKSKTIELGEKFGDVEIVLEYGWDNCFHAVCYYYNDCDPLYLAEIFGLSGYEFDNKLKEYACSSKKRAKQYYKELCDCPKEELQRLAQAWEYNPLDLDDYLSLY